MASEFHEVIVIGAGPGGLQASYCLRQHGVNHVVLEQNGSAGSSFLAAPVHRKLISINKRFNYFPEKDFNMRYVYSTCLSVSHSFIHELAEGVPSRSILIPLL